VSASFTMRRQRRAGRLCLASAIAGALFLLAAGPAAASVTFTGHPPKISRSSSAKFAWTAPRGSSRYCSLDGHRYVSCTHSKSFSNLGLGSHAFGLKVVNHGRTIRRSYSWKVVRPLSVSSITASCTGDVLSGTVTAQGYTGDTLNAILSAQQSGTWAPSGLSQQIVLTQGASKGYDYSFNVASVNGAAFQVGARGTASPVIDASTCAPATQLPEASMPVLLPLSVAGTIGVFGMIAYRRRRPSDTV
jgi:hypothetical protein